MTETVRQSASHAGVDEAASLPAGKSILDEIIDATGTQDTAIRKQLEQGLAAVLKEIIRQSAEENRDAGDIRVNSMLVDAAIQHLDEEIGLQVDAILHHPDFQALESAWRSLKYLVDRSPLDRNIEVYVLTVTENELLRDLEDQGPARSALFERLYSEAMGSHGGKPFSAMVANYQFSPDQRDMRLLENLAAVASMAHAPLIAAASPQLLGLDKITDLPADAEGILAKLGQNRDRFKKWQTFRKSANSRYVGLTLPRFMLRLPYGKKTRPVHSFSYAEQAGDNPKDYLWGSAAFALASCMSRSFARTRWYTETVGPASGGQIENLPLFRYTRDGVEEEMCPTEIYLNDHQEFTLAELGFIGLTMKRDSDEAAFFSGQAVFNPESAAMDAEAMRMKTNHFLNAHLPYTFIVTRISHYLKLIMREYIGKTGASTETLNKFVSDWVRGFVNASTPDDPKLLELKPLKSAEVEVSEIAGKPGFFNFSLKVVPHLKFKGAEVDLSLVGQLDAKKS